MAVAITLTDDDLVVKFTGLDALWAVSGGITLPLTEVVGAKLVDTAVARARLRWKISGTGLTGVVKAGQFTVADEPGARELWSTYRDSEYLEIATTRRRPHRIVVQHPDRFTLAQAINERARGGSSGLG
ncbi:MAG: hypothetical protein ABJC79_07485 [Acidimicrobiia bacterium]